jgi:hypothetical protein
MPSSARLPEELRAEVFPGYALVRIPLVLGEPLVEELTMPIRDGNPGERAARSDSFRPPL